MSLQCKVCLKSKPEQAFSKKKASSSGYSSKCKECHNTYVRCVWYPKNQAKQVASSRAWREKNQYAKLAYRYNTTAQKIKQLFDKHDLHCEICDKYLTQPNIDHCHNTGKLRGLLCRECNLALGFFKDDVNLLTKACLYLQK